MEGRVSVDGRVRMAGRVSVMGRVRVAGRVSVEGRVRVADGMTGYHLFIVKLFINKRKFNSAQLRFLQL